MNERKSLAQYSPAVSSAYGNALVSELRQNDESFFSDKSEIKSQPSTLAAALGQRHGSQVMTATPSSISSESLASPHRRPVSRHVSHIGYGQHSKGMSRLRRSSNGDENPFPFLSMYRRRSHDSAVQSPGGLVLCSAYHTALPLPNTVCLLSTADAVALPPFCMQTACQEFLLDLIPYGLSTATVASMTAVWQVKPVVHAQCTAAVVPNG